MKINEATRIADRRVNKDTSQPEPAKKRVEERRDAMKFLDEAAEFSGAAEDLPNEADRSRHVDEIKHRVRAGTYSIDSYKVADKFLREALVGAV